jgi:hypothetical protein
MEALPASNASVTYDPRAFFACPCTRSSGRVTRRAAKALHERLSVRRRVGVTSALIAAVAIVAESRRRAVVEEESRRTR